MDIFPAFITVKLLKLIVWEQILQSIFDKGNHNFLKIVCFHLKACFSQLSYLLRFFLVLVWSIFNLIYAKLETQNDFFDFLNGELCMIIRIFHYRVHFFENILKIWMLNLKLCNTLRSLHCIMRFINDNNRIFQLNI